MSDKVEPEFAQDLRLLGERIKSSRKERGLTVRDMVVQHGYHDAQWRRFEKGVSLTVPSLFRIAKALGLSLSILLDGVGEFTSSQSGQPENRAEPQQGGVHQSLVKDASGN